MPCIKCNKHIDLRYGNELCNKCKGSIRKDFKLDISEVTDIIFQCMVEDNLKGIDKAYILFTMSKKK